MNDNTWSNSTGSDIDNPREITLPADTMQTIMDTPGMADEVDRVSEEGGTAALIRYLDAHGLRWRTGGSDSATAFTDAATHGGLVFDGPLFSRENSGETQALQRRRAASKAARKARRANRR